MLGVFGQRLAATGAKVGGEFQINQETLLNQRTPSIAVLANGSFVVAWISEKQSTIMVETNQVVLNSVNVFARVYDSAGVAKGGEFKLNTSTNICANPSVAAGMDGGFVVVWGENNLGDPVSSWDVYGRGFDAAGVPVGTVTRLNATTYGDQYAPRVCARGNDYFAVWTSMGQDGSWEGVYGKVLSANVATVAEEFLVNTFTISRQIHPTVATDGLSRYLVVWSSFIGGQSSFDLMGQGYATDDQLPLIKPSAPYVFALSQSRLSVSWPAIAGYAVTRFELFMDGKSLPMVVQGQYTVVSNLVASSSHAFQLRYVLADGRTSPLSDVAANTTWGEDSNGDGLPDDWQEKYWGLKSDDWPASNVDSDHDGATNFQEFLAGTNPLDPKSVLRMSVQQDAQGAKLTWSAVRGYIYQIQQSDDMKKWDNFGAPRFANDSTDSIPVDGTRGVSYFRVIRIR